MESCSSDKQGVDGLAEFLAREFEARGAWAEVYTALQTGVADGQMNPIPIIAFAKFQEVQKFLTLTGHLFTPYVWVVNTKFWDGLSPEEKKVVSYAAKSAIVAGRGVAGEDEVGRGVQQGAVEVEQDAAQGRVERHHSSARRMKPTPRTVCSSFRS
jgi:TRAP-type C4-dicarboxylate transport system substrate-binding protein